MRDVNNLNCDEFFSNFIFIKLNWDLCKKFFIAKKNEKNQFWSWVLCSVFYIMEERSYTPDRIKDGFFHLLHGYFSLL